MKDLYDNNSKTLKKKTPKYGKICHVHRLIELILPNVHDTKSNLTNATSIKTSTKLFSGLSPKSDAKIHMKTKQILNT